MTGNGNVRYLPGAREAQEQPRIEPFRPFYASEMEGRAPKAREWMIDGVALRKSVLLFAGPVKIGKSLLLQQLLTAVSIGAPWLERETVQARAFGVFSEDPQEELERRQANINAHFDRTAADYELEYGWISLEGQESALVDFDRFGRKPKFSDRWRQLWDFVGEGGFQVVGLDNMRSLFGGNENDPLHVTAFIRACVRKAVELDGCIILAAHPNKSDPRGYAGSGAWLASVRAGMSLHRPKEWDEERDTLRDPRRVLSGLGSNYGAGIGAERLEIRDGVFLLMDENDQPAKRRIGPLSETERMDLRYRLLIGIKRVLQNGGEIHADEEHARSIAHRARRASDDQINRVPMNELNRAQQEMLEAGQVVRVSVKGKCLIRPADGPYYQNEEPWLPSVTPRAQTPVTKNAAD